MMGVPSLEMLGPGADFRDRPEPVPLVAKICGQVGSMVIA
jgi:hypothetical protein